MSVPILTMLALGYAVSIVLVDITEFVASLRQIALSKVGIAALVYVASTSFIALAWIKLIRSIDGEAKVGLWRLHARSWLARYIPGKILAPIARIQGGYQLGYSMRTMLRSIAYESAAQVSSAVLVGTTFIWASGISVGPVQWIVNAALILSGVTLGVLISSPAVLSRWMWKGVRESLPSSVLLQSITLYIGASVLGGIGVTVLIPNVNSVSVALYIIGATIVSGVVGIAASILPVGFGVRESMLAALLTPVMGAGAALSLAIVSRIVRIFADALYAGLCYLLDRPDYCARKDDVDRDLQLDN